MSSATTPDAFEHPVQAFERALQELQQNKLGESISDPLGELLHSILTLADWDHPADVDIYNTSFDLLCNYEDLLLDQKLAVAACYWHLFLVPRALEYLDTRMEASWKGRAVQLLESQVTPRDLYGRQELRQTFEKVEWIGRALEKLSAQLDAAIEELTSLDRFTHHRQAMMRTMNTQLFKVAFSPFLPPDFGPSLGELYKRVEAYLEQPPEGLGKVLAYSNAK